MKRCLLIVMLLLGTTASAQPFLIADFKPNVFGVTGGAGFGRGKFQGGFGLSLYHPWRLERPAPDFEVDGMFVWQATPNWVFVAFPGVGVTIEERATASLRTTLVLTQTAPIAFRTSLYLGWTPTNNSLFIQSRVGLNVSVNRWLRLFPHLLITMVDARRPTDLSLSAGWTVFCTL